MTNLEQAQKLIDKYRDSPEVYLRQRAESYALVSLAETLNVLVGEIQGLREDLRNMSHNIYAGLVH